MFYFKKEIQMYIVEFNKFITFIHHHNPLLISYYDDEDELDEERNDDEKKEEEDEEEDEEEEEEVELYENKYLTKYKKFTNEYSFNELDLKFQKNKFDELINRHYKIIIPNLETKLHNLNSEVVNLNDTLKSLNETFSIKYPNSELEMLNNWDGKTEHDDEMWDDFEEREEIKRTIVFNKPRLESIKSELNNLNDMTDYQIHHEARENAQIDTIHNKLSGFENNYIIEFTPVGNIIMRFNNYKKSFEYYSDRSISYKYLEPIARKYVMTYKCKNIFVDMDEEVKKANKINELKKNENETNNKNNKNNKKQQTKQQNNPTKQINKPYSSTNKNAEMPSSRMGQSISNPINDIELAVKNANRYTWEGRFADFKIIKSNKKTNRNKISFKDFKNLQQKKLLMSE
jgi:hypothetical protein